MNTSQAAIELEKLFDLARPLPSHAPGKAAHRKSRASSAAGTTRHPAPAAQSLTLVPAPPAPALAAAPPEVYADGAPDFITGYADYADITEMPRIMHESVAESVVAAILNSNGVTIRCGGLVSTLDHWHVLLSGSGGGRSTLVTMVEPVLAAAGVDDVMRNSTWGSAQALFQDLAQHPSGLFMWGELSERLVQLASPRFENAKVWLTDRYDSLNVPADTIYRSSRNGRSKTPPIVFTEAPRINILSTSSEEWFFQNVVAGDALGGFIPRFTFTWVKEPGRLIPIPEKLDATRIPALASQLARIAAIRGTADITAIAPHYDRWYRDTHSRFLNHGSRALAQPFFNRHRAHALKYATIYEAVRSGTLQLSEAAWQRAVARMSESEKTIMRLLNTGMTKEGYRLNGIAERIEDAAGTGIKVSALMKGSSANAKELYAALQTLEVGGSIRVFARKTAGRAALVLVSTDFEDEYLRQNPNDKPGVLHC